MEASPTEKINTGRGKKAKRSVRFSKGKEKAQTFHQQDDKKAEGA